MKQIFKITSAAIFSTFALASCGGGKMETESTVILPAVGGETSLRQAINDQRVLLGKNELRRTAMLDAIALRECQRITREGKMEVNLTNLQKELKLNEMVGATLGKLKDRGPLTGQKFVPYWMEGPNNRDMLLGDWTRFGVGTVRSLEGDMVTVVIYAK